MAAYRMMISKFNVRRCVHGYINVYGPQLNTMSDRHTGKDKLSVRSNMSISMHMWTLMSKHDMYISIQEERTPFRYLQVEVPYNKERYLENKMPRKLAHFVLCITNWIASVSSPSSYGYTADKELEDSETPTLVCLIIYPNYFLSFISHVPTCQ